MGPRLSNLSFVNFTNLDYSPIIKISCILVGAKSSTWLQFPLNIIVIKFSFEKISMETSATTEAKSAVGFNPP